MLPFHTNGYRRRKAWEDIWMDLGFTISTFTMMVPLQSALKGMNLLQALLIFLPIAYICAVLIPDKLTDWTTWEYRKRSETHPSYRGAVPEHRWVTWLLKVHSTVSKIALATVCIAIFIGGIFKEVALPTLILLLLSRIGLNILFLRVPLEIHKSDPPESPPSQ